MNVGATASKMFGSETVISGEFTPVTKFTIVSERKSEPVVSVSGKSVESETVLKPANFALSVPVVLNVNSLLSDSVSISWRVNRPSLLGSRTWLVTFTFSATVGAADCRRNNPKSTAS